MRIAFFAHRYWPIVGGVEIYLQRLSSALIALGHTVDVITSRSREDLAVREMHEGVRIHRFPALRSPTRSRAWLLSHIHLFRRADVIHVSNTHMLEYLWRMVGPIIDRRKVFLTRHGMSYRFPVPSSEKRRAVRSKLLAAGVVHDGEFIGKWLEVEPDLCPDQGLSPEAEQIPYVAEPPPNSACYIGRMEADSGIQTYIEAVRILCQERRHSFDLQVYGDGSLAPSLRERVEREQLPIRFHGRTAQAQDRISDACFAFLDGRMAIQEAMARRRLVFAAFGDPLKRDYVGTEPFSPFLVAVENGVQLADRIEYYVEHSEQRRGLIEQAYLHACSLSWDRTARSYLDFWQHGLENASMGCSLGTFLRVLWSLNRESGQPKSSWAGEFGLAQPGAKVVPATDVA